MALLADHYWCAPRHFSPTIHIMLHSVDELKVCWGPSDLRVISSIDPIIAFLVGCSRAVDQGSDLTPWMDSARCVQAKLYIMTSTLDAVIQSVHRVH